MLLGEGRQYLVAWSDWAKEVRMFSLTGFERIEHGAEAFERPEGFDLGEWQNRSFGVWQEEVHDVQWRFTPAAAPEARRYLFHPTQEMSDEPDGSLTVRFRAGGLREMCWHLFRWGDQVEVIGPEPLRALYRQMIEGAAVKRYSSA
jgi:predicted DNA-binding transcriptional regulator YafY